MKNKLQLLSICLMLAAPFTNAQEHDKNHTNDKSTNLKYPQTKKVDTVTDYFGTKVKDPYRWLEDDRSEATENWVKAEN